MGPPKFSVKPNLFFAVAILFFLSRPWETPNLYGSQTQALQDEDNQITVAMPSQILSLDPTNYRDRDTQVVIKNIFDSLTTRNRNNKVVPQLAESWKALDKTHWEFKLRRGVTFHNGDPLTAEDVRFTLERVFKAGGMDGKTSPRKGLLGPVTAVSIVDDYTIGIETNGPWSILPLMLSLQEIIPEKYFKKVGSKGFQEKPVGTGPFRFVEKRGNDEFVLERFEDYYGGSPQNPPVQTAPLKRLVFKVTPKCIDRLGKLKRGDCDVIAGIPPESVEVLSMIPNVQVIRRPATRSYFAEINVTKSPLDDRGVRLALNFAVDMRAIVDSVLHGYGQVLSTLLLPNAFAFNATLRPYRYDPELAKELLNASGWPYGYLMSIYCTPRDRQFADALAVFLTKAGIPCSVTVLKKKEVKAALEKRTQWDIYVTSWGNTTLDPVGILVPKFKIGGRGNYSGYSNGQVNRLLDAAEDTLDVNAREHYYKKVQSIVRNDVPMIFGYAAEDIYGIRKEVRNFTPSLGGMVNMHDVYVVRGE